MSTRVLPFSSFMNFNRMSDLRRRIQPPLVPVTQPGTSPNPDQNPLPGQSQPVHQTRSVRRNLFGPVDHEENMKSVQAELSKIAESDSRRWNFDFHNEAPLEGRFSWQSVTGTTVPVAYEMPNLTARLTQLSSTPSTSSIKTVTSVPKATSSATSSAFSSNPLRSALNKVTTASTTVISSTTKSACVSKESPIPEEPSTDKSSKDLGLTKKAPSSVMPKDTVTKFSTKQTHITDFLKVRKRPRSPSETDNKTDETSSPPPLLKRARSST